MTRNNTPGYKRMTERDPEAYEAMVQDTVRRQREALENARLKHEKQSKGDNRDQTHR